MSKTILAQAAFLSALLLQPSFAFACRCAGPATPQSAFGRADVIVQGKVMTVTGDINTEVGAIASVNVTKAWKGKTGIEIEILNRTTCAYDFKVGQAYLIFLNKNPDQDYYTTNICIGNLAILEAETALEWLDQYAVTMDVGE